MIKVREYKELDLPVMTEIWNEVVRSANAFPQTTELDEERRRSFLLIRCTPALQKMRMDRL